MAKVLGLFNLPCCGFQVVKTIETFVSGGVIKDVVYQYFDAVTQQEIKACPNCQEVLVNYPMFQSQTEMLQEISLQAAHMQQNNKNSSRQVITCQCGNAFFARYDYYDANNNLSHAFEYNNLPVRCCPRCGVRLLSGKFKPLHELEAELETEKFERLAAHFEANLWLFHRALQGNGLYTLPNGSHIFYGAAYDLWHKAVDNASGGFDTGDLTDEDNALLVLALRYEQIIITGKAFLTHKARAQDLISSKLNDQERASKKGGSVRTSPKGFKGSLGHYNAKLGVSKDDRDVDLTLSDEENAFYEKRLTSEEITDLLERDKKRIIQGFYDQASGSDWDDKTHPRVKGNFKIGSNGFVFETENGEVHDFRYKK